MTIRKSQRSNYYLMASIIGSIVLFLAFGRFGNNGVIPLLPGSSGVELIIMIISPLIIVPVVSFVFYRPMMKLYSFVAKKLKKGNYKVGYYDIDRIKSGKDVVSRAFMASTFSLAFGLFITQLLNMINLLPISGILSPNIAFISYFFIPITTILIPPLRWSEDLGVVLFKDIHNREDIPEVTSVGEYISLIYKGFTGITTPFLYIFFVVKDYGIRSNPLEMIAISLIPISLLSYFIVLERLFDFVLEKNKPKLLKKMKFMELVLFVTSKKSNKNK